MKISELIDQKIAILGFGTEGKSTLQFLKKYGCKHITILDKNHSPELQQLGYDIVIGKNYLQELDSYDIVIKSAGISPYINSELEDFHGKITTATEIFFSNYSGKVIGITGTKGKSTTASLCGYILKKLGYNTIVLGNIGYPSLDIIGEKYDFIVYEFSSYMLENFSPKLEVGALINIFPDHLDWYNMKKDHYDQAKCNIFKNATFKIGNKELSGHPTLQSQDSIIYYNSLEKGYYYKENRFYNNGKILFHKREVSLEGDHNMHNITCILTILSVLNIGLQGVETILAQFSPLQHRMQDLGIHNKIRFIDDAISTTPESTIAAIETYRDDISTIFLGGSDRGYDFHTLIEVLGQYRIKNIVLFPENAQKIKDLLDSSYHILETSSMEEAVEFGFQHTPIGKICLLSTACPSYSLWKNFEQQGDLFATAIQNYIQHN